MPPSTPVARSKSAALSRVLDVIPKGYQEYVAGSCPSSRAEALARKFHARYGIGCSPAQRLLRKQKGLANALLAMYWPAEAQVVEWLLLVTEGTGPVRDQERLRHISERPRLVWLGYELVQHPVRGRASWTWRRPKAEMAEWHALLGCQLNRRQTQAVQESLERAARQPGFAGVRKQTLALCQWARSRGYEGDLPQVYFLQKVSHGDPLLVQ